MSVRLMGDTSRLAAGLKRLAKPRLRQAALEIAEALTSSTIRRFNEQRDPEGKPWKPLAVSTTYGSLSKRDYTKKGQIRKAAERKLQRRKILIQSGQLKNSISSSVRGSTVHVGTNKVYAPVHQFGHKFEPFTIRPKHAKALAFNGIFAKSVNHPGSKVPARPFLGISIEDRSLMKKTLIRHLAVL